MDFKRTGNAIQNCDQKGYQEARKRIEQVRQMKEKFHKIDELAQKVSAHERFIIELQKEINELRTILEEKMP